MKFLLPLLALIPVAMGQGPFVLNTPTFGLDDPTRPIITVDYTNSRLDPPSANTDPEEMGKTVRGYLKECAGKYTSGSHINGMRIPGITDDYGPGAITTVPLYHTNFKITIDPSKVPSDIYDGDETNRATIKFCFITGLNTHDDDSTLNDILVDFTETVITVVFNLIDNSIESFLFTAKTEAAKSWENPTAIQIETITEVCLDPHNPATNGGVVTEQGLKVCFDVCVNQANKMGPLEDWRVSSLFDVVATGEVGGAPLQQPLGPKDDNQLVTWWGTDGNCFKVIFYPNAAYYDYAGNVVTINGKAKMSRLIDPVGRRLRNRELVENGMENAESDFELEVELDGAEGNSAGISIKQITFAAGVAGVALLV